ncbi:MAG TPA: tetratricopeptide repeat protein [Pirellulales bacterium]
MDEAAQILRTAVFLNPRHFEAQNNLGCVYRALGELDQAEQCFNLALAVRPDSAEALSNLGSALHDRKQYDAAAAMMRRALEINPSFVQAHNNLGTVLQDQKRFDEALEQYRAALTLDEKSVESLINVGAVLQMQGHPEQALDFHRRALAIDPNISRAHYSRAAALHALHRTDEALESYAEAIRLKPDYAEAYYNRSFVWLSRGDFAHGWPDYEWRFRCNDYVGRRFDAPRWDGSPLAGRTLLVHAEQGLGDTMHFIRYVKLLEASGGSVIVEVQPALLPLLKASGLTNVVGGGSPLPRFDVHASLLSLPGLLGTNLGLPWPVQIPRLPARRLAPWHFMRACTYS